MKLLIAVACLALACVEYRQPPPPQTSEGQYPNPFSPPPIWELRLRGIEDKPITVTVSNVLGDTLGIGFEGVLGPGDIIKFERLVRITSDSLGLSDTVVTLSDTLPSGVYFFRVVTPDSTFVRKVVILK